MKTSIPSIIRRELLVLGLAATAALGATHPAPAPDRAVLKARIEAGEKRAALLLDEVRSADSRIEESLDSLLEALRSVGDSKDSRTKVARMKEQTIDALQKNTEYFEQRRAALLEEMRRPTLHLSAEERGRGIDKLDTRIEKRVQQILALNKSLPTHKDYEQYKSAGETWYGTNLVENEDYKQNKRLTARSNTQRGEIIKELERSLDRLDRQNRTLRSQAAAAAGEAQSKALMEEIAKNDALAKTRRAQLTDTLKPSETPTRPISSREAQDLDSALRKSIDTMRNDFGRLFPLYLSYLNECSSVNDARAALNAMK